MDDNYSKGMPANPGDVVVLAGLSSIEAQGRKHEALIMAFI